MEKTILKELIDKGLSTRKIGLELGLSQTAVRYWVKKLDMRTALLYISKDKKIIGRVCKTHGLTDFVRYARGYRCVKCGIDNVGIKRKAMKTKAVEYKGGCCVKCGYNKCEEALEFHHVDPSTKEYSPARIMGSRSWLTVKKELDKCILICANCHRELHVELLKQKKK